MTKKTASLGTRRTGQAAVILFINTNMTIYMATSRKEKEASLASLTEDLKAARAAVFSEYRGMTVKQLDQVRKNLRKENVKYQVVKVTLLKKALAAIGINSDGLKYSGPLAVALSN